jgi:hypothetical protein
MELPQIWEGKKGQKSTVVRELNMEVRPLLDELIVAKASDFIQRAAKGDKPFFTKSGRMCSTAESPLAVRITSCRCSWLGPPAVSSRRAVTGSNPPQQRIARIPYVATTFGKSWLGEPDSSDPNIKPGEEFNGYPVKAPDSGC